jgi:hypothetical protein
MEAESLAPAVAAPGVAEAATAPAETGAGLILASGLRWAALAAIVAAVALFVVQSRRRATIAARADS